ncbi:copper resistance protein CopC [Amycolatopsis sp. NBC_00345]
MLATPANAHSFLVSSTPVNDSSIANAPAEIVLEFNEPLDTGFTELAVLGPDGSSHWEGGKPSITGPDLSAPLARLGPAGKYTVQYRVVSADGHPVSGSLAFTLTQPGPGSAVPAVPASAPPGTPVAAAQMAAPSATGGEVPVWVWIAAAVVLLIAGALVAARIGRGPDRPGS